jgi:spermidine synthase
MIIEILGAKMLAPYVGTSHFVWTAQIAVTLCALAAGYYAGGRMVDKVQNLARLYWCIMAASLYLFVATLMVRPVAYACLSLNLAIGSLAASTILFFIPLSLLSMTAPFCSRVIATAVATVGATVGRVTSIGTVGSLIGTILIGYLLIPFLPNSSIMFMTAAALLLVAAGYFFVWDKKLRNTPMVMIAVSAALSVCFAGVKAEQARSNRHIAEIFRANSNFGMLQVFDSEQGNRRFFMNDFLMQNSYDPGHHASMSAFTYLLHGLALAYTQRIESVLCIGMGIGVVPMQFSSEGASVDVVEINPAVVPVARRFFGCRPERFNLAIGDGRCFIHSAKKNYDAIVLDAFLGDAPPSHLMTREAFRDMKRLLRPGGVVVINIFGTCEKGKDFFVASLDKTLKSVFSRVKIFSENRVINNYYFLASDNQGLSLIHPQDMAAVPPLVRAKVSAALFSSVTMTPESGIVLTDDYNPVDYYDAINREELRKKMVAFARWL